MVVVLDIEVVRALTGDYRSIVISREGVKCIKFKANITPPEDIEPKEYSTDMMIRNIILGFTSQELVYWQPDCVNRTFDIIRRKDGKTLKIERALIDSVGNELFKILSYASLWSFMNIIYGDIRYLEVTLDKNEISINDKSSDVTCYQNYYFDRNSIDIVIANILSRIKKPDNINIFEDSSLSKMVEFNAFGKRIVVRGNGECLARVIELAKEYKESLNDNMCYQLKMEGF